MGIPSDGQMADKVDVKQGTLALMILTTLQGLRLKLNSGTLYPALLKLEQEGFITADWRQSENNRRAKFYALSAAGRKRLAHEEREWRRTTDLIAAFLAPQRETP